MSCSISEALCVGCVERSEQSGPPLKCGGTNWAASVPGGLDGGGEDFLSS